MLYLLLNWFVSAISLLIVAHVVPGFQVRSFGTALIASLIIGLLNATVGLVLKILTFPLTILTFGLFLFVVNALMLLLASNLVSGFTVSGFWVALLGAIVLALVQMVLRHLTATA